MLQLADDWEIVRLKRLTEEFLLKRLTEKTCVALFKLSHSAHSPRLKQAPRRGRGATIPTTVKGACRRAPPEFKIFREYKELCVGGAAHHAPDPAPHGQPARGRAALGYAPRGKPGECHSEDQRWF